MFYELSGLVPLNDVNELTLIRSRKIFNAIGKNRDFKIVQVLKTIDGEAEPQEYIITDVTCHRVPNRNRLGVLFRERVALVIPEDMTELVGVLALRKDFPLLMHQNAVPDGSPVSLCLFYGSVSKVLSEWTPERFLRRIQWWFEESAREALHPADQPVEQLFFVSPGEVVLPWDFDELCQRGKNEFYISGFVNRKKGWTARLTAKQEFARNDYKLDAFIFTLPTVVHGRIERHPASLGGLATLLESRGCDLLSELKKSVRKIVNENGAAIGNEHRLLIFVLRVPVVRNEGGKVESLTEKIFFADVNPLLLGSQIGALNFHNNRYYRAPEGLLAPEIDESWKSTKIELAESCRELTPASARLYSGTNPTDKKTVLIGAGALGSNLLDLWARSGWTNLTIIDDDHIKPHNLVRHSAGSKYVGWGKAEAVADQYKSLYEGFSIASVSANACDFSDAEFVDAVKNSHVVIDATASLDYPRKASFNDQLPRHVTVFLAPSGESSVLLVEDADRKIRQRSLEAQYYRALINEPWGANHVRGSNGSYWSGAGCRDLSFVLPPSAVSSHASTIAEQIPRLLQQSDPQILIWERDVESGTTQSFAIRPEKENRLEVDGMSVYIDQGILEKLKLLRNENLPEETGGVILGYIDFSVNMIVIVDVLSAPADSKSGTTFFERGTEGLLERIAVISKRTEDVVQYLGEWHSHPQGHSSNPSGSDVIQLIALAQKMSEEGLPVLSLIVGEEDIQILKAAIE